MEVEKRVRLIYIKMINLQVEFSKLQKLSNLKMVTALRKDWILCAHHLIKHPNDRMPSLHWNKEKQRQVEVLIANHKKLKRYHPRRKAARHSTATNLKRLNHRSLYHRPRKMKSSKCKTTFQNFLPLKYRKHNLCVTRNSVDSSTMECGLIHQER